VVRYLAEASWPRVQDTLRLQLVPDTPQATLPLGGEGGQQQHANAAEALLHLQQQQAQDPGSLADNSSSGSGMAHDSSSGDSNPTAAQAAAAAGVLAGGPDNGGWSPWVLCEALATKRHWVLPRSGRLDTYRAANWLLRAALAGQQGTGLAFLPPAAGTAAAGAAP
jgi:hypothetical protein